MWLQGWIAQFGSRDHGLAARLLNSNLPSPLLTEPQFCSVLCFREE